ncbi:MAG: alpha-N-acetylglucosaminidase C-terminal domain-containing protein [Clostridia bacterium]|nr:alpha-N-acetylglucosaminidase C-terminal domain-containing protein [Clostridia bacterium]
MIKSLISRQSPEIIENFVLEIVDTEDGKNIFSYEPCDGKVLLKGTDTVCLAVAYYHFMRDCCGAYFTADHSLAYGEFSVPAEKSEGEIKAKYRTCFEYTTFSCSACWWNWARWENEIDFMAMNGINMPLATVGTEAVWMKTMLELGMKEGLALASIAGPSFWSWQLSDCFDGYLPQTKKESIDKRLELGRKITDRERELGMTPIFQGFTGYIFRTFIQGKIRARMHKSEEWCLFPSQYQLSARDTMFHKVGTLFYKNQELLLGESKFYLADPFLNHTPAKRKSSFLAGVGTAVYKLISARSDDSVWVIHSSCAKPELLLGIPKDRVLIIDNGELCNDSKYDGYSFIVGTQCNGGDVTALHGDIAGVAANRSDKLNASGVGTFSDGAFSNEAFRQYSYAAVSGDSDVDKWLAKYTKNRYGTDSSAAFEAMMLLKKSCWHGGQPAREHASAVCTRPSVSLRHTAIGDSGSEIGYNISDVFAAAQKLIEADGKTYEYELDLCDVLRQSLSDLANTVCKKALEGYKNKDVELFEQNTNLFLDIIEDMDRLLLTKKEFSLPYHLSIARELGSDDAEKQNFEINLLTQITIFGPIKDTVLYDCCWKEWGGMLSTFYALRWRALFEQLAMSFGKFHRISEKTKNQVFDRDAYLGTEFGGALSRIEKEWIATYTPDDESVGKENTVDVAKDLVAKYAANF